MKKTAWIIGIGLFGVNCLLVTTWLGLSVEQQTHYLIDRYKYKTSSSGTATFTGVFTGIASPSQATQNGELEGSAEFAPPPPDHPPLHIICGQDGYDVRYAPHDYFAKHGVGGYSNHQRRLIVLDRQADAITVRENVIHELLHLSLYNAGGKIQFTQGQPSLTTLESVEEEGYVHAMAPKLRDCLVDNPELLKWLVKAGG